MHNADRDPASIEIVWKLIEGIEVAMLTTMTPEGLVSRPMKTQEIAFDGNLWFLTKRDTAKYDELQANPHVNLVYVGKSYVSIRGTAELVNDRSKIKDYWNAAYEKFLQTTSDDPELILIKVKADTAEYWETGNWLKVVKQMIYKLQGKSGDPADLNHTVKIGQ